jgi:hypothetical protein
MRRVSTDTASAPLARCHCHEWHPVAEIGGWLHGSTAESIALGVSPTLAVTWPTRPGNCAATPVGAWW